MYNIYNLHTLYIINMDIRHIRYFSAVAEEKSFSKAAKKLGINQPPLSMQIKDLEKEIGVELFHRSIHGAELTAAGQTFLKEISPLQQLLHTAITRTQLVGNGELGELRLGYTGTCILNPLIPQAINLFQQKYPHVILHLKEANSLLLFESLLKQEIDLAIVRIPEHRPFNITIQHLLDEDLVAVLSENYPCNEPSIDLICLKNEAFISSPYQVSPGLHDSILKACRFSGFEPNLKQNAPQIVSILSLISAGLGVSLVPASTQQLKINGIKYRKLNHNNVSTSIGLAYIQDHHCQTAINFSSVLHTLMHQNVFNKV